MCEYILSTHHLYILYSYTFFYFPCAVDGEEGTNQVDDAKYIRYCKWGCCGYGLYGRCKRCCSHAGEPQVHGTETTPEKGKYVCRSFLKFSSTTSLLLVSSSCPYYK